MKNIFKIFLTGILALFIISCEGEDEKLVLTNATKSNVSSDKSSVILNETVADQAAVTFTYQRPVFTPNVAFTNSLEFAVAGTNFSQSVTRDILSEKNTFSLTHLELNGILATLNVAPNSVKAIEVRLKSNVNSVTAYYSNVLSINMTGYTPNPDLIYPKINVPGGYAGAAGYADWTPSNAPNLFSPGKNSQYRGFIYVSAPNSEYKFTINQDWAGDKGDDGTLTGKLIETGEQNIKAVTAGTYYLKVDWTANTYSTTLLNFGVIGDATPTGYASDTDFVYNPATKTYVINSIALNNTGVFKFRANDDWAFKIQPSAADQTLASGTGVQTYLSSEGTVTGDPNYKVAAAGNYKIELDVHNSAYYKLTVTKL
nr:SusE domain-containing protein [uncultured Chryseobacterium sp.]